MQGFSDTITSFVTGAKPIIIAIVAVAFLIDGIMMIWPNERTKEKGKEALPWIIIGAAVALGAVGLASTVGNSFGN